MKSYSGTAAGFICRREKTPETKRADSGLFDQNFTFPGKVVSFRGNSIVFRGIEGGLPSEVRYCCHTRLTDSLVAASLYR